MTGKILLLSAICLSALTVKASDVITTSDSISKQVSVTSEHYLQTLKPTYLTNVSEAANWGRNWFIEVKGGASAFLGSPIGCGDVFDRLSPALQVGIGKWFTPAVGGRVAYQGLSFKNGEFKSMNYHYVHADFLYNLTSGINCNDLGLSRWDVIPFIGVGMIYNKDWHSACTCPGYTSGSHPFAFSYGLECRYRLNNRMQLVAELSGMTTAKNFDAVGTSSRFGDNMLTLSAGLSFRLGKAGYRRIVDANPYMAQNEWLLDYAGRMTDRNRRLTLQHKEDERIKAEYRKILEIEGLLDLYKDRIGDKDKETEHSLYPRNDYSGLNSLRARLNNKGWDGKAETMPKAMKKRLGNADDEDLDALNDHAFDGYLAAMKNGGEPIGASIYFFFRLGTDELTEVSQLLNIDEIARIAKKHHLKVRISGAADSATGNERINNSLSQKRAEYIKTLMIQRGIEESLINTSYEGGIDEYSPVQANRQTCVTLSF
jgi:outer membrane protein OmpA-like peptidoglycan-associated protein